MIQELKALIVNTLSYKTKSAKPSEIVRDWHIVDAEDVPLGRLGTVIASILRGKHKPSFTPHEDCGDYVIVVNARKVKFTGNKISQKKYLRYSGYPGGQRSITADKLIANHPTRPLENAVRGMLPKNRLGRRVFKKLFVYADAEHPHMAQQPKEIKI